MESVTIFSVVTESYEIVSVCALHLFKRDDTRDMNATHTTEANMDIEMEFDASEFDAVPTRIDQIARHPELLDAIVLGADEFELMVALADVTARGLVALDAVVL